MFDVAVGARAISHMGHLKMMGAVQPFISGAISKTVNMPQESTVEDIADAYTQAWHLGVKALAIYRDGSKTAQALRTDAQQGQDAKGAEDVDAIVAAAVEKAIAEAGPKRKRMPRERQSITHKFSIGGHEGYITAGMYEDGSVGEIFLTDIGKEGSTLRGMMNSYATAISIALQYGVPLETLVQKFCYMRFDPEGITSNPEIPFAKSMPDYIMRWLASRFLDTDVQEELGILTPAVRARAASQDTAQSVTASDTAGPPATPSTARPRPRPTARAPAHPRRPAATAAAPAPPRPRSPTRPRWSRPASRASTSGRPAASAGDDAAHGLLLHVQLLRQQHRLRLTAGSTAHLCVLARSRAEHTSLAASLTCLTPGRQGAVPCPL